LKNNCILTVNTKPKDLDNDGLIDSMEASYGTNIFNPDTDGDGASDLEELKKKTIPLVNEKENR